MVILAFRLSLHERHEGHENVPRAALLRLLFLCGLRENFGRFVLKIPCNSAQNPIEQRPWLVFGSNSHAGSLTGAENSAKACRGHNWNLKEKTSWLCQP